MNMFPVSYHLFGQYFGLTYFLCLARNPNFLLEWCQPGGIRDDTNRSANSGRESRHFLYVPVSSHVLGNGGRKYS
jgi:hypothetical protein